MKNESVNEIQDGEPPAETKPAGDKKKSGAKPPKKYTKEKIMASAAFKDRRDLVSALLEDGREYTKAEAEKLIGDYLKKEVI